jgi:UDP-N-acetylglucosamine 2-epimerase (non-hydrolysing)
MTMHVKASVRCACVIGTRPEAIKMAPIVWRLRESIWAKPLIVTTGQQEGLLEQALDDLGLMPDFSIPHRPTNIDVASTLASVVASLDELFARIAPDCIIAQGDTTSVLAASLVAFYRRIRFVHVEAGLRTRDLSAPFPEEFHRRAIAIATDMHCAPTEAAAAHLRSERIPADQIVLSGNTVIDALLETAAAAPRLPAGFPAVPRPILLTAHRRENFGRPIREALVAIRRFIEASPDTAVFYPVHPNPAVQSVAHDVLSNHPRIVLAEPSSYPEIVAAMQRAWLIVTDSGGLQEEGPALGKPVFVLRDVTERPEAVAAGAARLIGTRGERVFEALTGLHRDSAGYRRMAKPVFPYGDGRAAQKIVAALHVRMENSASAAFHSRAKSPVGSQAK